MANNTIYACSAAFSLQNVILIGSFFLSLGKLIAVTTHNTIFMREIWLDGG
jgi:hypothetical protein